MLNFQIINWPHEIENDAGSPNQCSIAFASIDKNGTEGNLNSYVLNQFGYGLSDLPDRKDLRKGYSWLEKNGKKPVVFIVTVGDIDTGANLKANLTNALYEYREKLKNKKVWIPLLGTGTGGLTLEESFELTTSVFNNIEFDLGNEFFIVLSIPLTEEGDVLKKHIRHSISEVYGVNSESQHQEEAFLNSSQGLIEDSSNKMDLGFSKLYESIQIDFFLVGVDWGKQNKLPEFIEKGIWENGYDEGKFSNVINGISEGDFLFAKSTFGTRQKLGFLRIKAMGIVLKNPRDGRQLEVNWLIKDINIDLEGLSRYRLTIHKLDSNGIKNIIFLLPSSVKQQVIKIIDDEIHINSKFSKVTENIKNQKVETIAGLLSDADLGEDYLDIRNDVNAFARVMAARSFRPPLAIALFGKWGSGKSFFMEKLKEQISLISKRDENGIFCNGVVQIHFNAWSYLDSNLWASLVSKIFEELNFYIRDFTKTDEEKRIVENYLKSSLSIAKEEFSILKNQQQALEEQIKILNFKKEGIEKKLNDGIEKIKKQTIWDALKKVDDEFKSRDRIVETLEGNDSFLRSQDQLKKIVPEKYWDDPERTYELIKSRSTFLKLFFRKDVFQNNLICLGFIILLVVAVPIFIWIFTNWLENLNFFIPQAIISFFGIFAVFGERVEKVYKALQPLVASFWTIKESYESEIFRVKSKFIQEEKGLNLEIEKSKAELIQIEGQIQIVENTKVDLEFRINNALATEALYSFIDRRSKSEDYKKHLGLISIIRKDFEILNDLFLDHQKESGKQKSSEVFRNRFSKPLERIILYIDDLDRCPEENVVQVLEAVNLLMAFPLFVVVVGVDARWVKNALFNKHAVQFSRAGNVEGDNGFERLEPSNYLEKIFQIPFQLKSATDSSVKNMIQNLAQTKAEPLVSNAIIENPVLTPGESEPQEGEIYEVDTSSKQEGGFLEGVQGHILNVEVPRSKSIQSAVKPEALVIESSEVEFMKEMSAIIGTNPRAIKRFVNIYRVIKAHEEFDNGSIADEDELMVILFLIALPLGMLKGLSIHIENYLFKEYILDEKFEGYFNLGSIDNDSNRKKLDKMLNDILERSDTLVKLNQIGLTSFRRHFYFIKRFTFSNL